VAERPRSTLGLSWAFPLALTTLLAGGTPVSAVDPSTAPAGQSPVAAAGVSPPTGMSLIWADEFDGPAGTPPDPSRWTHDLGDGGRGWGNEELEWYTNSPENAAHDGDGHLVITAREAQDGLSCWYGSCRYTSARLLTRGLFEFTYGRVETRLKVPSGAGLWPAFWMLGTDIDTVGWPGSGEIDVMENVGRQPRLLYGTIHGPGYSGSDGFGGTLLMDQPLADDFHDFAVDWEPDRITWSVDSTTYHVASPADVAPDRWAFDHRFFLILNLAVGGHFGGDVSTTTAFPSELVVDHVRVFQATAPG
jgi:beta-glucanase (GH16 family)